MKDLTIKDINTKENLQREITLNNFRCELAVIEPEFLKLEKLKLKCYKEGLFQKGDRIYDRQQIVLKTLAILYSKIKNL